VLRWRIGPVRANHIGPLTLSALSGSDDPKDAIGVESSMSYLQDLNVNLENASLFVALELFQAPSIGEITRKGFVEGWKNSG